MNTERTQNEENQESQGETYFYSKSQPKLDPKDLEDIGSIFDRIRVLYKKKSDEIQPPPKKLIAKN